MIPFSTAQLRCAELPEIAKQSSAQAIELYNFVVQSYRKLLILDCEAIECASNQAAQLRCAEPHTLDCEAIECASNQAAQLRCAELPETVNSRLRSNRVRKITF